MGWWEHARKGTSAVGCFCCPLEGKHSLKLKGILRCLKNKSILLFFLCGGLLWKTRAPGENRTSKMTSSPILVFLCAVINAHTCTLPAVFVNCPYGSFARQNLFPRMEAEPLCVATESPRDHGRSSDRKVAVGGQTLSAAGVLLEAGNLVPPPPWPSLSGEGSPADSWSIKH